LWVVFGRYHLGSALAALDEPEAALKELHRGRAEAERLNHSWMRPMTLRFEAQALATLGDFDNALARLDEALKLIEATDERWWEAEVHRIRGHINHQCGGSSRDSEASFQRAIEVARRQQARLFELRAASDLGHLWCEQGKSSEAHELIAPVYNWFNEGRDTPDLIEAKALLDELS
jgi:predicted ATPase